MSFDLEAALEAAKSDTPSSVISTLTPAEINATVKANPERLRKDFRVFLWAIFGHLGYVPTELQYDIARYLQHGPKRKVVEAFRGVGKSWITSAYALWLLYCDPQKKVMVVSASKSRAVAFTNFCLWLIREVEWLAELRPKQHQRQSSENFDVGPARPDQTPSFKAVGITGQKTGFRGDEIIPDDIEVPENSATTAMREKIKEGARELGGAILKPGGGVTYLGTPQTEESFYSTLPAKGYEIRIWPSEYPGEDRIKQYGASLSPLILNAVRNDPSLVGTPTEPARFSAEDLESRRIEWGRGGYALQFMLDTTLSDADRYPLRLHDLIVMGLDRERGPDAVSYGRDERLCHRDLPVLGFDRDKYYRPANVSDTSSPYTTVMGFLDPSGRGKDETALGIGAELHGRIFLLKIAAWRDGFSEETLKAVAALCVVWKLKVLRIESNFGGGTYAALIRPFIETAWAKENAGKVASLHGRTGIEEERADQTQKEVRIHDALGPITQGHRMVVNMEVIEEDWRAVQAMTDIEADKRHRYSLAYQFSHLTLDRGSLAHDDRLDAVAGMVAFFEQSVGKIPAESLERTEHRRMLEEFDKMMEGGEVLIGEKGPEKAREGRGAGLRKGAARWER